MAYLVDVLIPYDAKIPAAGYDETKQELVDQFGGVTLSVNSPAEGLWQGDQDTGGDIEKDQIIIAQIMVDALDRVWWIAYRKTLEDRFNQDEILIRVTAIEKL